MNDSVPESILRDLICLGSNSDRTGDALFTRLAPRDAVNRLHWSAWDAATQALGESDHNHLARGLVIAEEQLRWSGGSVAGAIWVYRSFARKFPASAETLASWMLASSNNPWVPFGSNRGDARPLEELHAYHESQTQRRKAAEEESTLQQHLAEARTASKQRLAKMRETIKNEESAARAALIEELEALPVEDRLLHLATDDEHDLFFYPPELLDGLPHNLSLAARWGLEKMQAKAAEICKGPWREWLSKVSTAFMPQNPNSDKPQNRA
jgi:uncharacterized protein YdhG (YjbR/CyaY superfamily)